MQSIVIGNLSPNLFQYKSGMTIMLFAMVVS